MKRISGLAFGEILWDIIEGKAHIGGAPFNLAAHMAKLGAAFSLFSSVGDDQLGKAARDRCRSFGIETGLLTTIRELPTGTVEVELDKTGKPEYTIHEPVAWDRIGQGVDLEASLGERKLDLIVFGTLAQRSEENRALLERLLDLVKPDERFFDVNLRLHYYSEAIIQNSLKHTTILKLNDEEVPVVSRALWKDTQGDTAFFNRLKEEYPIHTLLISRGKDGSSLFYSDRGRTIRHYEPIVEVSVKDTVGAGDSFSAAYLTAFLHGEAREQALRFASRLSSFVASSSGAVPEYGGWITKDIAPYISVSREE